MVQRQAQKSRGGQTGGYSEAFAYGTDGTLTDQWTNYNGQTYDDAESFDAAGRLLTKSDPGSSSTLTPANSLTATYDTSTGRIKTWQIPSGTYDTFAYDLEGDTTQFNATTGTGRSTANLTYNIRGEMTSEALSAGLNAGLIASFQGAAGFMYPEPPPVCDDNGSCGTPSVTWDPRVNAITANTSYSLSRVGNLIGPITTAVSYDTEGRATGSSQSIIYDALNRTLTAAGTAYVYGPGTLPNADGSLVQHTSMGTEPMFTTDSSNVLKDVKLAGSSDIVPGDSSFSGLTVYDRDMFGFVASQRNSTGTSAITLSDMYSTCDNSGNLGGATANFKATAAFGTCKPGGLMYPARSDGFYDGRLTFRGVRTYSARQWTSPDAIDGSYNYASNNPAMFYDPTGFLTTSGPAHNCPDGYYWDSKSQGCVEWWDSFLQPPTMQFPQLGFGPMHAPCVLNADTDQEVCIKGTNPNCKNVAVYVPAHTQITDLGRGNIIVSAMPAQLMTSTTFLDSAAKQGLVSAGLYAAGGASGGLALVPTPASPVLVTIAGVSTAIASFVGLSTAVNVYRDHFDCKS